MDFDFLGDPAFQIQLTRLAARLREHRAMCGHDIEDLAQSIVTEIVARVRSYDPAKAPPAAFALVCARSAAATILRHARRLKRCPRGLVSITDTHEELVAPAPRPSPRAERVRAAVLALAPEDRAIAEDLMRLGASGARARLGLGRGDWAAAKERIREALSTAMAA